MWKKILKNTIFMNIWIFILFTKELMVSLTEAVDVSPPLSSNPSEPLTATEVEVLKQHLLANGRWLLGLGKEELRLLSKLTGSEIGGDLLAETRYLDYIKPDFGRPVNPYQSGYPGATNNENGPIDVHPTFSSPDSGNLALINPTISPDISSSMISDGNTSQLDQDSLNLTALLNSSIPDPSDEDIVFKPLSPNGDIFLNVTSQSALVNNSNDIQSQENTFLSTPSPSQSASSETSPGDQSSPPATEAPVTQKPTVDPLIYPVQFYNQSSLSETKPSTHPSPGDHFNPLAGLADKYSDNFMGW